MRSSEAFLKKFTDNSLKFVCLFRFIAPNLVVLNLGSTEPQGFSESVSGFRWQEILSNKSKKKNSQHTFFFSNHEGFNECMYGTLGVHSVHPTRLRNTGIDALLDALLSAKP